MTLNKNTKLILGIAAAAGVGILLAMLIPPGKGNDLKSRITESLDDLGEKVQEMLAEGRSRMAAKAGRQNQSAGLLSDPGNQAVS